MLHDRTRGSAWRVAWKSEFCCVQAQSLYFTLLYFTLRRPPTCAGNSALLSVTDLRVVFIHGDICLARKGKIVRTGNSSTDSVQIELLEYSPLIAWDLSVCYPVQVSLLTPPDLWPSTTSLVCQCTHILGVCFVEGGAVCMVEQKRNSAVHMTFLRNYCQENCSHDLEI